MTDYEASRTLVKSPPELWAELSDQVSLAGHLAEPFGEIRITRLEPETAVAWEGERASGTVRIEPSGWGTRVTLTARAVPGDRHQGEGRPQPPAPEPAPLPRPAPAPDPLPPAAEERSSAAQAAEEPSPAAQAEPARRGLRSLFFGWRKAKPEPPRSEPVPTKRADNPPTRASAPPADEPAAAAAEAPSAPPIDPDAVLVSVLDRLGAAHHRPFSRS